MQKTNIPWTDFSWNPSVGCENNCSYCYARKSHNMRHKAYMAGKKLPIQYARPFEEIQLFPDRLEQPLHKKKPCKIFVGSVTDLFSPSVPFEFIEKVFSIIDQCPQHTFQILTKRPEIALEHTKNWQKQSGYPSLFGDNLWLGWTIENQEMADLRTPIGLQIPAAVRFVSIEPCLGAVKLNLATACDRDCSEYQDAECPGTSGLCIAQHQLDWVIIGAESKGSGAGRECKLEWVRSLVQQCKAAGVKVFVKQLHINGKLVKKIEQFPKDLQVQEYPERTKL